MQIQDNIKVAVRICPLKNSELAVSNIETCSANDSQIHVQAIKELKNTEQKIDFDFVFSKHATQKDIFEKTLEYQVLSLLDGYNYTLLSYGASGTGKSHTLMKIKDDYGMVVRSLNKLFQTIENRQRKIKVYFSYVEIYQENLADLLNNTNMTLEIREDTDRGCSVHGCRELQVTSTQEVLNLIEYGKKHRRIPAHEILQFQFIIEDMQGLTKDVTVSRFIVADLSSAQRGAPKNQNISINAFNECLTLLIEGKQKGMQNYIPFRNSKLTRLLQQSLGGNSKTLIISCISPSVTDLEETLQTLNYSSKARGIVNKNEIITMASDTQAKDYSDVIEQLKKENNELKKLLKTKQVLSTDEDFVKHFEERILQHYSAEQDYSNQTFKFEWESEILKYRIRENQMNLERVDGLDRKQADSLRQQLQSDEKLLNQYLDNMNENATNLNIQLQNRKALLESIIQQKLPETMQLYLESLIKQNSLKIENQEIKHKDELNILQKQQQEKELAILRSQISLRDKIIVDQKKFNTHKQLMNEQKHYSQLDTNAEEINGTKASLKHYPLPALVKDHYFNKQAYEAKRRLQQSHIRSKNSPRVKQSPRLLKSPGVDQHTPRSKIFVSPIPQVRIMESLSQIQLPKKEPYLENQRTIDTKSMAFLPKITPGRNLNKFVYDWNSGGYKFTEQQPMITSAHQKSQSSMEKSFYSSSSRTSNKSPNPNMFKQKILLPQNLKTSNYVQGFVNQDLQRRNKLLQLNLKMRR